MQILVSNFKFVSDEMSVSISQNQLSLSHRSKLIHVKTSSAVSLLVVSRLETAHVLPLLILEPEQVIRSPVNSIKSGLFRLAHSGHSEGEHVAIRLVRSLECLVLTNV